MTQRLLLCAATLALLALPAFSQNQPLTDSEKAAIWDAAKAVAVAGPADVPLKDQAQLHLADTYIYVPQKEGAALMHMWGNSTDENFTGLVFPRADGENWVVSIDHVPDGYVKDDDAKTWNADELLSSIKEGNEQQNEERVKMGIAALDIVGWVQPPLYDSTKHQLVWSLKGVDHDGGAGRPATINYNTYALGRDGYFEVNMMTEDTTVERDKAHALNIVSAVDYLPGKRYSDFSPNSDKVAAYGLGALVAGVAAKKLGLLAVAGVFLAKFAKLIIAGVAVLGGGLTKFFRRKADH